MSFTIVARRQGITIFNSRNTSQEAFVLAAGRRREGAEDVRVYNRDGRFLDASTLIELVRQQGGTTEIPQPVIKKALSAVAPLAPEAAGEGQGVLIMLCAT